MRVPIKTFINAPLAVPDDLGRTATVVRYFTIDPKKWADCQHVRVTDCAGSTMRRSITVQWVTTIAAPTRVRFKRTPDPATAAADPTPLLLVFYTRVHIVYVAVFNKLHPLFYPLSAADRENKLQYAPVVYTRARATANLYTLSGRMVCVARSFSAVKFSVLPPFRPCDFESTTRYRVNTPYCGRTFPHATFVRSVCGLTRGEPEIESPFGSLHENFNLDAKRAQGRRRP